MKYILILTSLICALNANAQEDLGQLYEKAYFLETAKGQPEEALILYNQVINSEATEDNRQVIIQSLERMVQLHKCAANKTLQDKMDNFDANPSILEHIIGTFGEPSSYVYDNRVYAKDDLPSTYTMSYPGNFFIEVSFNQITTLSFEEPNYCINDIKVGSSLKDVVAAYPPKETIISDSPTLEPGILYLNKGDSGHGLYTPVKGVTLIIGKDAVHRIQIHPWLK